MGYHYFFEYGASLHDRALRVRCELRYKGQVYRPSVWAKYLGQVLLGLTDRTSLSKSRTDQDSNPYRASDSPASSQT